MLDTHSHNKSNYSPLRVFTAAVLNGVPVPERARALLEANGVNTAELEHRMLHQIGMRG